MHTSIAFWYMGLVTQRNHHTYCFAIFQLVIYFGGLSISAYIAPPFFFIFNRFIELSLTYKKLYIFKIYNFLSFKMCIHLWNHHEIKLMNVSLSKSFFMPLLQSFSLTSLHLFPFYKQPLIYFLSPYFCLEFYINTIIHYTLSFSFFIFSSRILLLKFINICQQFLVFCCWWYTILLLCHVYPSPIDGCLDF